jgi:beta-glucosidase
MKKEAKRTGLLYLAVIGINFLFPSHISGDSEMKVPDRPIYQNTSYSFEERAADLISRLTLEEKESLLGNSMPAVPRLGIHAYNLWSEALHGVMWRGFNSGQDGGSPTSFPNSVALGSSWDPDLMQREATAISDEARAINSPVIIGLTYWSPVVEPIRDPRWGRTGESFGEDPFLISKIAGGFIRGMMGSDEQYLKSVPCGKHYFANNSEFDRHVSSSDMDNRDMREFYLAPYKALIEKDHLPSIMSCYNAVNGVPVSASKYYLDTIARRNFGLKGYITGDCAAIEDIYTGHYYVETAPEATALGLKAGVDTDCGSVYQSSAIEALNMGLITEADIDRALLNVFTIRMRTGEFDPPAKVPYSQFQPNLIGSPANKALALEIAMKTPVMLKNEIYAKTNRRALPLDATDIKRIALLGPQVDEVELGPYSGRPTPENTVSPLEGIKKYISEKGLPLEVVSNSGGNTANKSNLFYVAGFELRRSDGTIRKFDATKYSASSKGITVGSGMGEIEQVRTIDDGSWTSYDNIDLTNVDTIGINLNIPIDGGIVEVRIGSPEGNLLTTLNATVAAGARAGGVYGSGSLMKVKVNKLGLTEPQTLYLVYKASPDAPIGEETIEMAASADVAVIFVGTDEKTATEEADRLTLLLPGNQVELIKAVAAVNPNTIVVMQTLGCVEVEEFKNLENIPGIIWTGYNGQAQGDAIARLLFGERSPGGKLNATWYKSIDDLPGITDYSLRGSDNKNGRTYWYFKKDVSYEFGYGLSYTSFEYDNFRISKNNITPQDKITVWVDITNSGDFDGDEVVQVYMRTPESPVSLQRPIKRLKGFKRVTIARGQTKTVPVEIDCADLWFWDQEKDKITFDQGKYVFEIGSSSKDIRGQVTATMDADFIPVLKTVVADCGTVVLRNGSKVQTNVTAAMTDDSFYDISRAKVVYSSNNPMVASVDEHGLVTAKGVGVATITAHVSIGENRVSDSYPVKIMPELSPAAITVNNKPVPGFDPLVNGYSYIMKRASDEAPEVRATPADPAVSVKIDQAENVPGSAIITLMDNITVDKKEYVINFGTKSVSDEFNSNTMGNQWSWIRENQNRWSLTETPGWLTITGEKGDVSGASNTAENILLQSANTDWTILSGISFSRKPSIPNEQGGIIVLQDEDNYVKLVYRNNPFSFRTPRGILDMIVENNGYSYSIVNMRSADVITNNDLSLILKLERKGMTIIGSYSTDGITFSTIGTITILLGNAKAGLFVCRGLEEDSPPFFGMPGMERPQAEPGEFKVSYDYFKISNSGLK